MGTCMNVLPGELFLKEQLTILYLPHKLHAGCFLKIHMCMTGIIQCDSSWSSIEAPDGIATKTKTTLSSPTLIKNTDDIYDLSSVFLKLWLQFPERIVTKNSPTSGRNSDGYKKLILQTLSNISPQWLTLKLPNLSANHIWSCNRRNSSHLYLHDRWQHKFHSEWLRNSEWKKKNSNNNNPCDDCRNKKESNYTQRNISQGQSVDQSHNFQCWTRRILIKSDGNPLEQQNKHKSCAECV